MASLDSRPIAKQWIVEHNTPTPPAASLNLSASAVCTAEKLWLIIKWLSSRNFKLVKWVIFKIHTSLTYVSLRIQCSVHRVLDKKLIERSGLRSPLSFEAHWMPLGHSYFFILTGLLRIKGEKDTIEVSLIAWEQGQSTNTIIIIAKLLNSSHGAWHVGGSTHPSFYLMWFSLMERMKANLLFLLYLLKSWHIVVTKYEMWTRNSFIQVSLGLWIHLVV